MTKRMLIDSTHAEETRVVVLDGNRLEDYDVETSTKQQLKGNIYLAKIVRVEPSLQAAFVEFGGGRHGFLAFGEIHPDYYQIPVADRKRLLEMQEAEAREEEEEEEREAARQERGGRQPRRAQPESEDHPDEPRDAGEHGAEGEQAEGAEDTHGDEPAAADAVAEAGYAEQADPEGAHPAADERAPAAMAAPVSQDILVAPEEAATLFPEGTVDASGMGAGIGPDLAPEATAVADGGAETAVHADVGAAPAPAAATATAEHGGEGVHAETHAGHEQSGNGQAEDGHADTLQAGHGAIEVVPPQEPPENLGGELDTDETPDRRQPSRFLRNYKIQEVIRRRQIMLVQVVKEERGTKGAALTTYISLAGRFSVLMPNSPRGGGISRKITSAADRRRLKEITAELELPRGMGLIVRTAGAARPKPEIIRDCEYLLGQWDEIRETTMKSMAPALIYEEASLIKRAIRDVYSRDVEEILVDGEAGWRAARDFMRMLMPAHAKKVQLWRDPQPLFAKAQVESQLDSMLQPSVQLRSGGYLVINQTEALVAIDVNSGRSTRERGIEETAVRTNLEAAEEAARQLRLRDLAGLIVIDFIDMESRRNNVAVEKRLKDALKNDRARIQVGSISHFGLLEMSRQRLRPSIAETNSVPCPHCGGTGHMRSTESAALAVLRGIEDEGGRLRSAEIVVHVSGGIALYILNHKRARLAEIETRFGMHVTFGADEGLIPPQHRIEKIRALLAGDVPAAQAPAAIADEGEDLDAGVTEADDIDAEVPEAALPAAADGTARTGTAKTGTARTGTARTGTARTGADASDEDAPRPGETAEETEQRKRKRRRRRRGGRREEGATGTDGAPVEMMTQASVPADGAEPVGESTDETGDGVPAEPVSAEDGAPKDGGEGERKRRGRRGGRRRRREPGAGEPGLAAEGAADEEGGSEAPAASTPPAYAAPAYSPPAYTPPAYSPPAYAPPVYSGPTPANPFGGDSNAFAFFDAVEDVEELPPARPARGAETPQATADDAEQPAQPAVGPAIAPIVVGAPEAANAPKKQGWWKR